MTQNHQFMSQAEHVASGCEASEGNHDCLRTSARYRRYLAKAMEILGFLREQAQESGSPFVMECRMGTKSYDADDLDELWDGLNRVDSHFWYLSEVQE